MVSAKSTTALVLLASVGSSLAAVPATGTYARSGAVPNFGVTLSACDTTCLSATNFGVAVSGMQLNIGALPTTPGTCTCSVIKGTFTGTNDKIVIADGFTLSSGGAAWTAVVTYANKAVVPGDNSGGTKTTTMPMTSSSSAKASPTVAAVRRRREIFKRAEGDNITLQLKPTGGTQQPVSLVAGKESTSGGIPAPSSAAMPSSFAAVAAGFSAIAAALAAGLVAF